MENYDKIMADAQYRKGMSIAFFNSTNSAIELLKFTANYMPPMRGDEDIKAELVKWRDWSLAEHLKNYAEVIAKIGQPFDPNVAIAKLDSAKDMSEVRKIWLALSEDERQVDAIIQKQAEVKARFK